MLQTLFDVQALQSDDIFKLVESSVQYGLADTAEEVVVLNLQILARLTEKAAVHVISKLEQLMQIFEKKLAQNYKLVASQQS